MVAFHASAELPDPPPEKPKPGYYLVRHREHKHPFLGLIKKSADEVFSARAVSRYQHWSQYEFSPVALPDGWA